MNINYLAFSFNPRSHEGSDPRNLASYLLMCVSIHAPTKGATQKAAALFPVDHGFNPRSHEGSDLVGNALTALNNLLFQSTLPRRERLTDLGYESNPIEFQSTLPRRERLLTQEEVVQSISRFNPRSHEGSDQWRHQPRS